jgi:hypothetical protein
MHLLHRRHVHMERRDASQLQSILEWIEANHGLTSKLGEEPHCGRQRSDGLTHATRIGQYGCLNFLNRPDIWAGLIAHRKSDLQQNRSHHEV